MAARRYPRRLDFPHFNYPRASRLGEPSSIQSFILLITAARFQTCTGKRCYGEIECEAYVQPGPAKIELNRHMVKTHTLDPRSV